MLLAGSAAQATPTFSLDGASPSLSGSLTPDDVLRVPLAVDTAGSSLGMADDHAGGSYDDLDALSYGRDPISDLLYFSVDRVSVGATGTSVFAQAAPGSEEAHGDVYVSRATGFQALHIDDAALGLVEGFFGDDLDALEMDYEPLPIHYFSIDSFSASNGFGTGTLANDILLAGLGVYASGEVDIGLAPGDDIDALVLDDRVNTATLDPGIDMALFSLDPLSPSVISGAFSGADIFITDFTGGFAVFRSAEDMGLLATDDINALDSTPEPSTAALVLLGLLGMALIRRQERRPQAV